MMYRTSFDEEGDFDYYLLEKDVFGNIVAVYNESGTKVVSYCYDAWGNCTVVTNTDSHAALNPFRYRGYYLDTETNLYYLQTRYYDSYVGRFINADSPANLGAGDELQSYNLFSYCLNNPVNMVDYTGCWPNWDMLAKGALLVAIGVCVAAATIMTAGTATLCLAGAMAATAITSAAICTAAIGASEVVESITGTNVIRETVGEDYYNTVKNIAVAVTSLGMGYLAGGGTFDICFVAGTQVQTADGGKSIETIAIGDMVWATDPESGKTELKQVVQTFRNETDELVHVTVNGEEIVCTPTHPFYVPQKGWTDAIDLRAGDRLQLLNGEYVIIEQVQHEILEAPVTVYNFEVEGFHTYYVTESRILVHNANCGNQHTPTTHPNEFTKMKGNQGYRDSDGNFWKRDMLHKDHYDVSNSKGVKIKEVTFDGRQIWPDGPKNKNK